MAEPEGEPEPDQEGEVNARALVLATSLVCESVSDLLYFH